MARHSQRQNAKRSNRPNPREDRNQPYDSRKNPHGYREEKRAANPRVKLLPRNLPQERYLEALSNESNHIVIATGPAGTGKTLLATQYAIQQYQSGEIKKIILTRPVVSVDEQIGFLPGGLIDKLSPWMIPIMDIFKEHYSIEQVTRMIENEIIEMAPLGMQRGRTFKDTIVILDEAQNTTDDQMKMMLTRIGDGCKMIVTGDTRQHDRGLSKNGLNDIIEKVKRHDPDGIALCEFTRNDIERHYVVGVVLNMYGED